MHVCVGERSGYVKPDRREETGLAAKPVILSSDQSKVTLFILI